MLKSIFQNIHFKTLMKASIIFLKKVGIQTYFSLKLLAHLHRFSSF